MFKKFIANNNEAVITAQTLLVTNNIIKISHFIEKNDNCLSYKQRK